MEGRIGTITLKCLNCGANLRIGAAIVEFACEYCGASQVVLRDGGIVCLQLLSAKVDRIRETVDRTAAELGIHRLNGELEELEEKYNRLEESDRGQKELIKQLFFALFGVVCISGLVASGYAGSIIPAALFILTGGIVLFFIWRRIVSGMTSDFDRGSKHLIDRGSDIKKRIIEHEKIVSE